MRILLGVILFVAGVLGFAEQVSATDWGIEEVNLRATWQDKGAISPTYELKNRVEADWFQLQSTLEVYGSGTSYYALTNYLTFEKYLKNFKWNFGVEEAADYKFVDAGADFQEKIMGNWRIDLDCAIENRIPKGAKGSSYRADSEEVELLYEGHPIQYSARFRRQGKDYPTNTQYTSLKNTLENTFEWEPCPALGFDVTYQEDSGAYPTRINQNYWKDKWSFGGHWNPSKAWAMDWSYSVQEWFKGFFPYRRDYWYQSGLRLSPNESTTWSLTASVHGLAYCDTDYPPLIPGEWRTDETKSRTEEKVNLEYGWRRGIFTWDLGYFIERADYQSSTVPDKWSNGFYSSMGLHFKHLDFTFGLTPGGSIGNRYSRYQLAIGYRPN